MLKELQRLCKLMNIPVLRDAPDCQAAVSVYPFRQTSLPWGGLSKSIITPS